MKKFVSFILFFLLVSEVLSQRNYMTPEPQKITFPESKQNGFRLSKKTSLELSGVDNSKNFIKNFSSKYYEGVSFENDKTSNILDTSIITKKEFWDKDLENNLSNILKRYKKNSNASK